MYGPLFKPCPRPLRSQGRHCFYALSMLNFHVQQGQKFVLLQAEFWIIVRVSTCSFYLLLLQYYGLVNGYTSTSIFAERIIFGRWPKPKESKIRVPIKKKLGSPSNRHILQGFGDRLIPSRQRKAELKMQMERSRACD